MEKRVEMSYEDEEARDYYFARLERYREMFAGDNVDDRLLRHLARGDSSSFSSGDFVPIKTSISPTK